MLIHVLHLLQKNIMSAHRFILQKYSGSRTRVKCPSCGSSRSFVRYVDLETEDFVDPFVGRCNREVKCGYHLTPKLFYEKNGMTKSTAQLSRLPEPKLQPSYIPIDMFEKSLSGFEKNHFIKFLLKKFSDQVVTECIEKYFIGTSGYWEGSTIFWQIDNMGKIRGGKVMLYNQESGKRVKTPINHISWFHRVEKILNFNLNQCLFGEHLLKHELVKPVALVESEKTAIIASLYLPQFVWLATGGISIDPEKCATLKNRNVVLFPDINGLNKWQKSAKNLKSIANIQISSLLENRATVDEIKEGYDIADFLLKFQVCEFSEHPVCNLNKCKVETVNYSLSTQELENKTNQIPVSKIDCLWDSEIVELENYFYNNNIPHHDIKLNKYTTISKADVFIDSHIKIVKRNMILIFI